MRSIVILLLLQPCLAAEAILAQSVAPAAADAAGAESHTPQPDPTSDATTSPAAGEQAPSQEEKNKKLRRRKLEIGLIFTSGIVVLGIFLVVLTLLYGRRMRRQLAIGRGESATRDELWYLKQAREATAADESDTEQEGDAE